VFYASRTNQLSESIGASDRSTDLRGAGFNTSPLTNPRAPELRSYYPSGIGIVPNQIEVISPN
jgi:hypothetical protein